MHSVNKCSQNAVGRGCSSGRSKGHRYFQTRTGPAGFFVRRPQHPRRGTVTMWSGLFLGLCIIIKIIHDQHEHRRTLNMNKYVFTTFSLSYLRFNKNFIGVVRNELSSLRAFAVVIDVCLRVSMVVVVECCFLKFLMRPSVTPLYWFSKIGNQSH